MSHLEASFSVAIAIIYNRPHDIRDFDTSDLVSQSKVIPVPF